MCACLPKRESRYVLNAVATAGLFGAAVTRVFDTEDQLVCLFAGFLALLVACLIHLAGGQTLWVGELVGGVTVGYGGTLGRLDDPTATRPLHHWLARMSPHPICMPCRWARELGRPTHTRNTCECPSSHACRFLSSLALPPPPFYQRATLHLAVVTVAIQVLYLVFCLWIGDWNIEKYATGNTFPASATERVPPIVLGYLVGLMQNT